MATSVLVVAGSHGGQVCGPVIHERLVMSGRVASTLHSEPLKLVPADFAPYDAVLYYGENSEQVRDLTDEAEEGLRQHVRSGKGLVSLHVASYRARLLDLVGGRTPPARERTVVWPPEDVPRFGPLQFEFGVRVVDGDHPVSAGLDDFRIMDELYQTDEEPGNRVLLRCEEQWGSHPMAWVREYGAGRVFHTVLGHRPDCFGEPRVWRMMVQGVLWAAGAAQ